MKKNISLLIFCCLTLGSVMAQNEPALKAKVSKCIYFDVSPPLRDMLKTVPPKADMSWKDGIVKNILYPPGILKDGYSGVDTKVQDRMGNTAADSLLISFDGNSNTQGVAPPDVQGDVGPDHYFQAVNLHYSIYDKAGNKLLGPLSNSSMFNGLPNNSNDGDAVVLYDEVANRWIFSQFSLPNGSYAPFYEMVAVSQTGDPLGSWYRYEFQFSQFPDYPKLAVWPDGIYMSSNNFASGTGSPAGTGAACLDKAAMYAGLPATMQYFSLPYSYGGAWAVLPSDCDGVYPPLGTPNFFGYLNSGHITIYGFHVDWTNPGNSSYTLLTSITVASYNGSVSDIPQPGTTYKLDPIPGRLMFRLPFRKFNDHWTMVCNSTVNVSGRAGIRWWELRNDGTNPANWTIYQESTFSPADNDNRWMGSIAIDSLSNIALGYSISSSTRYPSVFYTGRQASDPLNSMTITEKSIVDGGGSQTTNVGNRPRWGDYSSMNVDPKYPGKFWYTQEYYKTSNSSWSWYSRIGTFSIGNGLMATVIASPATLCANDSTHLIVQASGVNRTYTYSWTSKPAGFTSTAQNPWTHPLVNTTFIVAVNDGAKTIIDSTHVIVQPATEAIAGNDTTYCNYVPVFTVHGSGIGYDQNLWQTMGDGYFDDPTLMVTQYHPMTDDKLNGVKLYLTVHAKPPCSGLVVDTVHILFDPCTGLNDPLTRDLNINVKPNPSNGTFNLIIDNLGKQSADVVVTDLQGHPVYHQVYKPAGNNLQEHLDLSFLPKGSYIMKVQTDTRSKIEKIIIQ
ncbi:MAG: T9SS type A sorting domain-containing protein [Bacteroidetes bacterium]|nr:T9SS type A sorting domain-containing protein [Bacteroidota bacterium]